VNERKGILSFALEFDDISYSPIAFAPRGALLTMTMKTVPHLYIYLKAPQMASLRPKFSLSARN